MFIEPPSSGQQNIRNESIFGHRKAKVELLEDLGRVVDSRLDLGDRVPVPDDGVHVEKVGGWHLKVPLDQIIKVVEPHVPI